MRHHAVFDKRRRAFICVTCVMTLTALLLLPVHPAASG
jgi:hypothetical protein